MGLTAEMARKVIRIWFFGILLCLGAYFLLMLPTTRSSTLSLEPSEYELTYTIAWRWSGMDERYTLTQVGAPSPGPSSKWIEIFKKPYNSGMALYRTLDGSIYYFGLDYQSARFDPASGTLDVSCQKPKDVVYTTLGGKISKSRDSDAVDAEDPGARRLFGFVQEMDTGAIPASPPDSRYYAGLKYLGKFGLVEAGGRGDEVGFAAAGRVAEPRLALDASCG